MTESRELDRELLRTPFVRGGRELGARGGIDCYGVAIERLRRHGITLPDVWVAIADEWAAGNTTPTSCMPAGWHRVRLAPIDGDLVFLSADRLSIGVVEDGCVWTATESSGVVRLPLHRVTIDQVWRRA